jgi:hypothetical protein
VPQELEYLLAVGDGIQIKPEILPHLVNYGFEIVHSFNHQRLVGTHAGAIQQCFLQSPLQEPKLVGDAAHLVRGWFQLLALKIASPTLAPGLARTK